MHAGPCLQWGGGSFCIRILHFMSTNWVWFQWWRQFKAAVSSPLTADWEDGSCCWRTRWGDCPSARCEWNSTPASVSVDSPTCRHLVRPRPEINKEMENKTTGSRRCQRSYCRSPKSWSNLWTLWRIDSRGQCMEEVRRRPQRVPGSEVVEQTEELHHTGWELNLPRRISAWVMSCCGSRLWQHKITTVNRLWCVMQKKKNNIAHLLHYYLSDEGFD